MGEHRSFPKPVARLVDRTAARRRADHAWAVCKRIVDARDGYKCRACGRHVRRTLTLCPERAEHHHLVSRRLLPRALHTNPQVVVLLCAWCHQTRRLATFTTIVINGEPLSERGGPAHVSLESLMRHAVY